MKFVLSLLLLPFFLYLCAEASFLEGIFFVLRKFIFVGCQNEVIIEFCHTLYDSKILSLKSVLVM